MDTLLRDTLRLLGLSPKEVRFMLSAYTHGSSQITTIAKSARLERSTAYLIAQTLLEKRFIREDFKQYRKNVVAVEPKTLLRMVAAKQRTVRRQEMELEEHIEDLESFYQTAKLLPEVRVFQGKSALSAIWKDVLSSRTEILLWTNQKTESLFFTKELHEKFITERIRKRLSIRVLAVNNEPGKALLEHDELSLRHSKLLPIHTTFSSETYLYDTKIAMLDYKHDTIGIIINTGAIASTQREIFEMTWRNLSE